MKPINTKSNEIKTNVVDHKQVLEFIKECMFQRDMGAVNGDEEIKSTADDYLWMAITGTLVCDDHCETRYNLDDLRKQFRRRMFELI